jgi:hypothetical protein
VLDDVAHESDYWLRRARAEITDELPSVDTMQRLILLAERAGQWARVGLDAGTTERQTRAIEAQALALATCVQRILDRLELSDAQRELVPTVLPEELERLAPRELEASRRRGGGRRSYGAPWVTDVLAELAAFPNGAHDDICDAVAYAARISAAHYLPPETGPTRPHVASRCRRSL